MRDRYIRKLLIILPKVIFEKKWGYRKCYDDNDPAPLKRIVEDRISGTKQIKEAVGELVGSIFNFKEEE